MRDKPYAATCGCLHICNAAVVTVERSRSFAIDCFEEERYSRFSEIPARIGQDEEVAHVIKCVMCSLCCILQHREDCSDVQYCPDCPDNGVLVVRVIRAISHEQTAVVLSGRLFSVDVFTIQYTRLESERNTRVKDKEARTYTEHGQSGIVLIV